MTPRTQKWLVALAVVLTGLIALATQIDIPGVSTFVHPRVECQDSPRCRAFIDAEIRQAITARVHHLRHHGHLVVKPPSRNQGGGGNQSGAPPGQPPGGGGHGHPPPPPNPGPPPGTTTTPSPPPPRPAPGGGTVRRICHLTALGARVCHLVGVP